MRKRRMLVGVAVTALAAATLVGIPASAGAAKDGAKTAAGHHKDYLVLLEQGADRATARAAIERAGGRITAENRHLGTATVTAPVSGFATEVARSAAIVGATSNRPIGWTPDARRSARPDRDAVEQEHVGAAKGHAPVRQARAAKPTSGSTAGLDPLDDLLWGLRMVRSDSARTVQAGDKRVMVGILDSGIDASNPDLTPNFNRELSRNFVTDIPEVDGQEFDGPCEYAGCVDPVDHDDSGHGTHVAGTVAAAANGSGVSGVAPGVSLVSIRGGQDSGYLFLGPVVNALTYGADIGLDAVNMSFYIDPWLYNCTSNPADSAEAQEEQRTIIATVNRALNYAHDKGVTLVGSLGNNHEDLGHPRTDISSPDFPPGNEYERPIDNSDCVDLPVEGPHVIGISALGPSQKKADYSNYGVEQISVGAPGGWFRDGFGTPSYRTVENEILSTYPKNVLQVDGFVDDDGNITQAGLDNGIKKACTSDGRCGYYAYLQGTSMASPHATGVAALIVSQFGHNDGNHKGGLTLAPDKTERVLTATAADHACPTGGVQSYVREGRSEEFTATCEGTTRFNGFYGEGIVDAYSAVTANHA